MKRFFLKLSVICVCVYVLLFFLQKIVDHGVKRTSDDFADWNLIFDGELNDSIVIMGSSRAKWHYDPILIEKLTGMSTYNLGMPGANLGFERILWDSYLLHNKPNIVIQNVDVHALSDENKTTKQYYLPYYDYPPVADLLEELDETVYLERCIPMSKYRGFEQLASAGIATYFGKTFEHGKIKGYTEHNQKWNNDFAQYKAALKGKPVDYSKTDFSKGFLQLQRMIDQCKKRNIKFILIWSPQYTELAELQEPTYSKIKKQVAEMARKNNIAFWDFTKTEFNTNTDYFYNSFHMNSNGVAVFNRQFADSLKIYIDKN